MIQICKLCGEPFETNTLSKHYCDKVHYKKCIICGKEFEFKVNNPYTKCCSRKCGNILRKQNFQLTTKVCELCGKEFHPKNNTQKYCKSIHYRPCPVCGEPVELDMNDVNYARTCSKACREILTQQTCMERYGVPVASQSEEVKQKLSAAAIATAPQRVITNMVKYGVPNPAMNSDIKTKISNTVRSQECQNKIKSTMQERYGVNYAMQNSELLERQSQSIQDKYGVPYFCMSDKCKEAQGQVISNVNKHFGELLSKHDINYELEFKLGKYSFDFHILDTNILIELDPTYTHNAIGNHWGYVLDKYYHHNKSCYAKENGYRCIHVWDWDDITKVIQLLSPKIIIYARNCNISQIDNSTASKFENLYHLQGSVLNQSVCYGLFYRGELVQVMTFGKPRYNRNYEYELLRLCSNSRYRIVGGSEKLWKHFLRGHCPKSVISYCDTSKFDGEVYEHKLEMHFLYITEPNKIWSNKDKYITNNLLLQRGYDQLFHTNYGKGTSNEQLMLENGWLPVYDCGQSVYVHESL